MDVASITISPAWVPKVTSVETIPLLSVTLANLVVEPPCPVGVKPE